MTAAWLSARWGVDTVRINAMRRAGELFAVRSAQSEWIYPSWQFDDAGKVRPEVRRLLAAARERGVAPDRLAELLARRSGMTHRSTLLEALLAGNVDRVVAALA